MALLRTAVNPPRFENFRHMRVECLALPPDGLRVLDVGCGGGLLSEAFARLGCAVTGVDRSAPAPAAARAHALRVGWPIGYLEGNAEALPLEGGEFDIVCCCDVLERVDDADEVIGEIARVIRPGGVFFFDTIERTFKSKLVAVKLAQDWCITRLIPRDVHVWDRFIRPDELVDAMAGLSLATNPFAALAALIGHKLGRMSFSELGDTLKLASSADLSLSYMGFAAAEWRVGEALR